MIEIEEPYRETWTQYSGEKPLTFTLDRLTPIQLKQKLQAHSRWLKGNKKNFYKRDKFTALLGIDASIITGFDFSNTNLSYSYHTYSTFINCDFSKCKFHDIIFRHVNFTNCNFTGAKFSESFLTDVKFTNCDFTNTEIIDCMGLDISGLEIPSTYWGAEAESSRVRRLQIIDEVKQNYLNNRKKVSEHNFTKKWLNKKVAEKSK